MLINHTITFVSFLMALIKFCITVGLLKLQNRNLTYIVLLGISAKLTIFMLISIVLGFCWNWTIPFCFSGYFGLLYFFLKQETDLRPTKQVVNYFFYSIGIYVFLASIGALIYQKYEEEREERVEKQRKEREAKIALEELEIQKQRKEEEEERLRKLYQEKQREEMEKQKKEKEYQANMKKKQEENQRELLKKQEEHIRLKAEKEKNSEELKKNIKVTDVEYSRGKVKFVITNDNDKNIKRLHFDFYKNKNGRKIFLGSFYERMGEYGAFCFIEKPLRPKESQEFVISWLKISDTFYDSVKEFENIEVIVRNVE